MAGMSPDAETLLQEAIRLHQVADYKKGINQAEKARKQFQKDGRIERAAEALRVMGDCTLNARDIKNAEKIYKDLMREGISLGNLWFQSAAHWGLGQVSLHRMDYSSAADNFQKGLDKARRPKDKWYTAWNAFGLANTLRSLARIEEATARYRQALALFQELNQPSITVWVERALSEIGGDLQTAEGSTEIRVWLCPLCGSKFNQQQAIALKSRKMVTCEYCGTSVG